MRFRDRIKEWLAQRQGSSLIIVVMFMSLVTVLGTSMSIVAMNNFQTSRDEYYHKQAYYTARSAIEAFISQLDNAQTVALLKNSSFPINGTGALDGMGSYVVNIDKYAANEDFIKVTATGTFNDCSESISILLTGEDNAIIPTEFVLYGYRTTNFQTGSTNATNVSGNTYYNGIANFGGANKYKQVGNMLMMGSMNVTGGSANFYVEGKLIATGALAGVNSSHVSVGIYSTQQGGGAIEQVPESDIGIPQSMRQKVKVWQTTYYSFDTANNTFDMILANGIRFSYGTNAITMPSGEVIDFGNSGFHNGSYQYKDENGNTQSSYNITGTVTLQSGEVANFDTCILTLEDGTTIKQNRSTVTIKPAGTTTTINRGAASLSATVSYTKSDGTVVTNATLSAGVSFLDTLGNVVVYSEMPSGSLKSLSAADTPYYRVTNSVADTNITFDTSAGDIRIYANSDIKLSAGSKITISGSHNVYLYIDGYSVEIQTSSNIGEGATSTAGKLCIVSNTSTSAVKLVGNCTYRGMIYLVDGTYEEVSGLVSGTTPKLRGSITAANMTLTTGNRYEYEAANELEFNSRLGDGYFIYSPTAGASIWTFQKFIRSGV